MKKNSCQFAKLSGLRTSVAAVVSCFAFLAMPAQVSAAGLGKVVVFSALGQPLRAEIEVNATAAELSGMRAQLASQEAFRQAGLDYTTSLRGITFTLDRRAGKKPVIRVASDTPISEPLVDMLVELNWSTGRLVREYTFLLDPPEVATRNTRVAAVPVAFAQSGALGQSGVSAARSSSISEETRARARAAIQGQGYVRPARSAQMLAPAVSTKTRNVGASTDNAGGGDTYVVRQGDTLHKIASDTKPDGVTLEQMLIGLLRANQQAFGGGNMNRLKAGKILTIPGKGAVESIPPREARKIIATQTAEWHAYRTKLASIAAKSLATDSEAQQGVAGKITAKVEDKFPEPGRSGDQVRVSGSGAGIGRSGSSQSSGTEDSIARDKALNEASDRVAMLEQNVAKLQRLLELKDQALAELQKQADAAKTGAAPESSPPAEASRALVAAGSTDLPKPEESPAIAAQTPEMPMAPASSQLETPIQAAPVANDKPAVPAVPEIPTPKQPVSPPLPEPSFLETVLSNPMVLAGVGAVVVLLGGLLFLRRRQSNNAAQQPSLDPLSLSTPSVGGSSNLTASSVFRNTGGQSVDTSHASQTDFSQAGPGSIDTEEVDPVAEADVYMAYGRDAQAEEILLEAKRKDPFSNVINLKLLEVYVNRKDAKRVDALAKDLHAATGGKGTDWEKAVALGQRIAPENPLFAGRGPLPSAPVVPSSGLATTPGSVSPVASASPEAATALSMNIGESVKSQTSSVFETTLDMSSLDFDLGAGKADAAEQAAARAQALDFSLDVPPKTSVQSQPSVAAKETALTSSVLDFTLPEPASGKEQASGATAPPAASLSNDLEFDVDLTASTFLGNEMPRPDSDLPSRADTPVVPGLSQVDMGSIDLNLEETQPIPTRVQTGTGQVAAVVTPELINAQLGKSDPSELSGAGANEDISTKLDLAKAYEEMGDLDGARELLREVVKEGNSDQREKASSLLTKLGN